MRQWLCLGGPIDGQYRDAGKVLQVPAVGVPVAYHSRFGRRTVAVPAAPTAVYHPMRMLLPGWRVAVTVWAEASLAFSQRAITFGHVLPGLPAWRARSGQRGVPLVLRPAHAGPGGVQPRRVHHPLGRHQEPGHHRPERMDMTYLRDYQRQALAAFRDALGPEVNRVAIEMATGLGKTVTGAQAAVDFLEQDGPPGEIERPRVLVLVPTDEICGQWVTKLRFAVQQSGQPWTIGVVKAERNEPDADIVVASVQTLAKSGRRERVQDVGFIVVDECHHAVAASYVSILRHYGAMPVHQYDDGPLIPVLGLSATLSRTDGQGLGRVFQDMPFSRSLSWAIRKGYLIDLVPYTITIPGLDLSSDSALDGTLADSIAPEAVVETWMDKARMVEPRPGGGLSPYPYPSTVLFAPLVKSAQAFADAFNAAGVKAEVVHGAMPRAERQAVLDRYEAGVTTVVCNAMALTEGWDSPRTMCVIVGRPTKSVPLFVQMVGRGLRPWLDMSAPPREDQRCVLLCVQGTATDLATVADLSENIGEVKDGQSFLAMEDQWDIGRDIQDEPEVWTGPVRVERWAEAVQRSSKAWKYTARGVPFLPTDRRGRGYVFCVQDTSGTWGVWSREHRGHGGPAMVSRHATAPDLELAMAVAEDVATDLGGDVGALLADKTRAWRKVVPSQDLLSLAVTLGLQDDAAKIMSQRAAGKAGKLSDLVSRVQASKVLDRVADKIKERGGERAGH